MSDGSGVKSVGLILKEARMAKSLSLEQASKDTKIHLNILKNIETDEINSLGLVYAKSFLRIYAEYLGLNKEDIVRLFEDLFVPAAGRQVLPQTATARIVRFASEKSPVKVRPVCPDPGGMFLGLIKKVDFRLVIFWVVILFVVVLMMKFVRHHGSTARILKKVEVKKKPAQRPQVSLPAAVSKNPSVKQAADLALAGAQKSKSASLLKPTVVPKEEEKVVLTIKAKTKSWLQVKVDGKVVFQNILTRGRGEMWQAKEKIEIWLGDAGAVQLELNGRLFERIGRPGQMLKHVVATKAGLSIQK